MKNSITETTSSQALRKVVKETHKTERKLESVRSGLRDASFAYGRRNGIRDIMHDRCGGECTTDDDETFATLMLPFAVEAAYLHKGREPFVDVPKFFQAVMPAWVRKVGSGHILDLVADALKTRATAPEAETFVDWLPRMDQLVADLRVTRDERQQLGLRGWGCVDPASLEERREADRERKRLERAAKGATPRDQSASRTMPWKALGISRRTWERRQAKAIPAADANSSAPCMYNYGRDENATPPAYVIAAAGGAHHVRPV